MSLAIHTPHPRPLSLKGRERKRRRGLTLIEVLMSAFVLSFGLFGVAAMLPVAFNESQQGTIADRKAVFGRQAYREFRIRQMARADNWIDNAGAQIVFNPAYFEAFCIDPYFTAVRAADSRFGDATNGLRRVTLRSEIGSNTKMSKPQALKVFFSLDDLIFEKNEADDTLPPYQKFLPDTASPQQRLAEGNYSWMATVCPRPGTDTAILSIVIFLKRDRDLIQNATVGPSFYNVNGLEVPVTFHSGGIGGGEVTLSNVSLPEGLRAKVGSWLMLKQKVTHGTFTWDVCKWYRVVNAEQALPGTTKNTQDVTLRGPDWNSSLTTTAVLVDNVIHVYEKTIRMEKSNLWRRQ